ncbi:MAG: carbohydrate kinase family protein [Bacteroidota bacterium]|nr:carbohydrate kinase family protein [Bacteroidota bacterium]
MKQTQTFDVAVAGLAVVDVLGSPINVRRLPNAGSLRMIESLVLTTGGNVSNVGIDLAKLGFRVAAITRIGKDDLGEFLLERYRSHNIDCSGITFDERLQTSGTIVCVDKSGERTFLHSRGCLKRFRARDILARRSVLKSAKIIAVGYLGLLPEIEPHFPLLFGTIKQEASAQIFLDTGGVPRVSSGTLKKILPLVDFFIPSYEEARLLSGRVKPDEIVHFFRECGASGVVGVKLGKDGCYITENGRAEHIPAVRARRVVDTTGAGDAFAAGFLAGVLRGKNPFDAARLGASVAASCVTSFGASTGIQPLRKYL